MEMVLSFFLITSIIAKNSLHFFERNTRNTRFRRQEKYLV
uniref:Uncharacterized protein n=1 Tax=Rhizophora mucronata TaxID=61149 RepID=A0A2P2PVZ2_RHIMU